MGYAATIEVGVVKVTAIEISPAEVVPIDDRSTVGDIGVVVVDHPVAMPVRSPVTPAPAKASEETDSKSNAEGDRGAAKKDSGYRIPARISDDRCAVDQPRIVRRHVNHFRIGRLDDDRVALSLYLLLFVAIEVAGFPGLLTHNLYGI